MTLIPSEPSLPAWLKRYDGLAADGSTPITKAAWRRARAQHGHPQLAPAKGAQPMPSFTLALINESLTILNLLLPLAAAPALRDRIIAHGAALENVQQKALAKHSAASARAANMRKHITAKTGRKVELRITSPSGKDYTAHSYKAAAAMVGRKASSLRSMACQHGGKFTVGYGDEKWLVEKLA